MNLTPQEIEALQGLISYELFVVENISKTQKALLESILSKLETL